MEISMSTLVESNTNSEIDALMSINVLYFASLADEANCH